jgi:hypothetical protein
MWWIFSTKALALYVVMGYGQGISNVGQVLVCKNWTRKPDMELGSWSCSHLQQLELELKYIYEKKMVTRVRLSQQLTANSGPG